MVSFYVYNKSWQKENYYKKINVSTFYARNWGFYLKKNASGIAHALSESVEVEHFKIIPKCVFKYSLASSENLI